MPISVFCHVCNHGNNINCVEAVFMCIKNEVKEIVVFGKLFQTIVVSMAKKTHRISLNY